MKKILSHSIIFILCCFVAFNSQAQSENTRVLSYSQWFEEMTNCQEPAYILENASIRFDPTTDQRFLGMDSVQLSVSDTIKVNCAVILTDVRFTEAPFEGGSYWLDSKRVVLQNIVFADSVGIDASTFEIRGFKHCAFTDLSFDNCNFGEILGKRFYIESCHFEKELIFWLANFQSSLEIKNSTIKGDFVLNMIKMTGENQYIEISNNEMGDFDFSWSTLNRIIFNGNKVNARARFYQLNNNLFEVYDNHFSPNEKDSIPYDYSLFQCDVNRFKKFFFNSNTYQVPNTNARCFYFFANTVSERFRLSDTDFPNHIILAETNITGSFDFGEECTFKDGIFLKNLYFNERSTVHWSNLENKIKLAFTQGVRQNPQALDSIQSYGLLERELGNKEYCNALIKNKRMFQSVFRTQGLIRDANAVMVEIKDLETAIWKHEYMEKKSINAYFNWKMNQFLKTFSAYGTNPVIAIIYSLKVILLFGLIYLFFHNDWDIGSRKIIGKRLRFILTYFQVNKGLSELDQEQQLESRNEVTLLASENEVSTGKIPVFFTRLINWYVKSNLISDSFRKFALSKMDILSGTFSNLPKKQQRKVAVLSGAWFMGFLLYTLLLKVLNALTLSLNAFTTLGFGNIPTKGFSRYIVIVQGFIGWVLMTVFSVTLITQLLQ